MSEKKLTKTQKQILTTLRDVAGAVIILGVLDHQPRLYIDKTLVKPVVTDSFYFIRPWLKESYESRTQRTRYTFREGAEISDAWRTQELERLRLENQRKQEESARIIEQETAKTQARLREAFVAIERGDIDKVEPCSWRGVRFQYGGYWYEISEEDTADG